MRNLLWLRWRFLAHVRVRHATCKALGGDYMALKRMSIKVSEEMHSWLSVEAEKRGLTMNAIIIFALENYYRESIALPSIQKAMDMLEQQKRNG